MVVVLIVAAGAGWESPALAMLSGRGDVVVLKRCVDVDDLLATATSGQADVAVLGVDAPGLDAAAVDRLRRAGVRPVVVAPGGELWEAGRSRAARIGVRTVVADDDLVSLPEAIVSAEPSIPAPAGPPPALVAVDDTSSVASNGRVVVVWGPAGAPGRTTVAAGLASELARRQARTILVDADPYGGSVAQVLGILDEVSGLLAASRLAGAGALEERFASVQRGVDPWLTVVTGLPRPDRWTEVRAGTVEALLALAAAQGQVLVDTGFSLEEDPGGDYGSRPGRNQLTLAALSVADEVVVVGNADPVGLSRLARGLVELNETTGATTGAVPVRVVVNRMRPSLGWAERDIVDMVTGFARPVGVHFLPEDRAVVDRALVSGRTLGETAPDSALVRALAELADAVTPLGSAAPTGAGRGVRLRRRTAG